MLWLPVSWSGFPGSQQRVPGVLCWGVHVRDHLATPLKQPALSLQPYSKEHGKQGDKSSLAGKALFVQKQYCSSTDIDKNFPSEKCQSSKILQGQVSLVNSNDWSFLASCPLACLLAIPSVPALHSISPVSCNKTGSLEAPPWAEIPRASSLQGCKEGRHQGSPSIIIVVVIILIERYIWKNQWSACWVSGCLQ